MYWLRNKRLHFSLCAVSNQTQQKAFSGDNNVRGWILYEMCVHKSQKL